MTRVFCAVPIGEVFWLRRWQRHAGIDKNISWAANTCLPDTMERFLPGHPLGGAARVADEVFLSVPAWNSIVPTDALKTRIRLEYVPVNGTPIRSNHRYLQPSRYFPQIFITETCTSLRGTSLGTSRARDICTRDLEVYFFYLSFTTGRRFHIVSFSPSFFWAPSLYFIISVGDVVSGICCFDRVPRMCILLVSSYFLKYWKATAWNEKLSRWNTRLFYEIELLLIISKLVRVYISQ